MFNISSRINTTNYCMNSCTEETRRFSTVYLSSCICINITGIVINTIIICVYQKNKQLKTKSNVIIVTVGIASIILAASEIVCAAAYIISTVQYLTKDWLTVQRCIESVLSSYCILAMALMSVQRLSATSHMQRPNAHTNLLKTKILLLLIGSFTTVTSIKVVSMFNTVWFNITFYMSRHITKLDSKSNYFWMIYNALFSFLPSCVTIGSYIYIENRIRRKSGTLQRKIKRQSLSRSISTRADMKSSWGIIIILIFIIIFHFPTEALTFLLATQRKLLPHKWLYLASILMSNIFQQYLPTILACTSTRYRLKLRKSFIRTKLTIHTNDSVTLTKRFPSAVTKRKKLAVSNNRQFDRYNSTSSVIKNPNRQHSIQILHSFNGCSTNDNNKGSFLVQYVVEKESVMLGIGKTSEEDPNVESEHETIQNEKNTCRTRRRRFTDSELTTRNTKCYFLKNNSNLVDYRTYSDNIIP